MNKIPSVMVMSVFLALLFVGGAQSADVAKGKKVFNRCKACHTLVAGKHRIGPSLHGIFGRTAGSTKKYRFSKAMRKAGANGLIWNEEALAKYLTKPRSFVKGTKMVFAGIRKKRDMENLMAFLSRASK
ncbi:MAG: cytochrome c family protein [Pseudomonadota bacterium]|nr:cytochrome c family protein [Pseudomonadota bacterium]